MLAKRSRITTDAEGLIKKMDSKENRNAEIVDILMYRNEDSYKVFRGSYKGTIAMEICGEKKEASKSAFWQVFIPNNFTKTLAEMTEKKK